MTYFVQLVQIQKEMKLCNQTRVLISKEKLLYLHPKSSFFRFVSDLIIIFLSFDHQVCFLINEYLREAKRDRKKEKSVVPFTREQNIISSQTQLYDIAH